MNDLIILFLVGYLTYQNAKLAKQKGKAPILWAILTVVAMFVAMVAGTMIVMIGYRGALTTEALNEYVNQNPLKVITVHMISLGGYLVIRYLLDTQIPTNKKD